VKALILALALALPGIASAYPQYQLGYEPTCTGCHVSPSGGGLLNENGLNVAEQTSTYGGAPEAAHGALVGPSWLQVSGDFRGAAGLVQNVGSHPGAFPMQAELNAAVHTSGFTLYATGGFWAGHTGPDYLQLREHWLMWQQKPGETEGLYVRVGRFTPVFGLRLVEHNDSVRRWGQTPLWSETYNAAVEYVDKVGEVHATGFVHDPWQYSSERGDGGALYGELRLGKAASIGLEARYAHGSEDARSTGGLTAKYWIDGAKLLFQLEGQVTHQKFAAGGSRNQLASYLMASWLVHDGWLLDFGVSQYNEDLAVKALDTEALDVNLHWFTTSHLELLLTNRIQTIVLGGGGPTSGYSLVQFHYRL
jgi:hypothetical protein